MDPETGAAGYIISGGHSGGATVDVWIAWKVFWFTIFRDLCDTDPITADITFPPEDSYFPSLGLWDFLFNNQLHFDVTYTICYEGGGTKTVYEIFRPHYPYPPGNYTFHAGCGTGETRDYTMFGVEIETPDGEEAIAGCDSITLDTNFIPSTPPSISYQWGKSWSLFSSGDGTFTPDNAASTEFQGTDSGNLTAKVEASNTYGTTKGEKGLKVIGVKKIKAEDSDDGSNSVEDADKGVEADIQTIYVGRKDTGTVNIAVETDPSVAESGLPGDWKIEKVSGSLAFDGVVSKLAAKIKKNVAGHMVVKISPCSGSSDHFQVKILITEVEFKEFAPCSGFDPTINPPWLMVPLPAGSSNKAQAEITPPANANYVEFESADTGKATVSPAIASTSPQTVTASSVAEGETNIEAKIAEESYTTLGLSVKKRIEKTIAIHAITEENDDVQEIDLNQGKPNAACVNTGTDGICNTAKAGDDIQLIPLNQGMPNETMITAGVNSTLDTSPSGDDTIVGSTITTGPNGVCDTTATGDDVQVIPVGNGKPNATAIDTGADGICDTNKAGDDTPLITNGNGLPNHTCVSPGTNSIRDTNNSGDDLVTGESISTGPDGICDTTANSTDVAPVNVPTVAALRTYLNDTTWGKQANVHFTVTRSNSTVNFDIDRDGMLDDPYLTSSGGTKSPEEWGEINEITTSAKDATVHFNIYYVDSYEYPVALSDRTRGEAWIGDAHSGSTEYITAHEVGHLIGRVGHAGATVGIDLMGAIDSIASPCRIIKKDWDYVNP